MRNQPGQLENQVEEAQVSKKLSRKEKLVDIGGNISYGMIAGTALDLSAGLNGLGLLTSRVYGFGTNFIAGAPYGMLRDYVFKKRKQLSETKPIQYISRKIKNAKTKKFLGKLSNSLAELIAFDTVQIPFYMLGLTVSTTISEGQPNLDKIMGGAKNLAIFSPFFSITTGWYLDALRKAFNLKSAPEKAEEA